MSRLNNLNRSTKLKIKKLIYIVLLFCILFSGFSKAKKSTKKGKSMKPVIVIAAFGSSMESGLKNLEAIDTQITKAFPKHEVHWALTAQFIINKLKKAGQKTIFTRKVPILNLEDLYKKLKKEKKEEILVVNLLCMVGSEFRDVLNTPTRKLNVKYCYPLLFNPENIQNSANALTNQFGNPKDTATILVAHGNAHHPENNAQLIQLDRYLRTNFKNTYLASVEGQPEFEKVRKEVKASGVIKVKFIPFMLTFGDHMSNDIMGDEEDSWKSQLGLEASTADGMGSNPAVIEIFIREIKGKIKQF